MKRALWVFLGVAMIVACSAVVASIVFIELEFIVRRCAITQAEAQVLGGLGDAIGGAGVLFAIVAAIAAVWTLRQQSVALREATKESVKLQATWNAAITEVQYANIELMDSNRIALRSALVPTLIQAEQYDDQDLEEQIRFLKHRLSELARDS